MHNLVVLLLVFPWCIISQKWQKILDFVICAQTCRFYQYLAIDWKKLGIFAFKMSAPKLTSYPAYFQLYAKLGGGITSLALECVFPKVTKKTGFCHQRPNTPILPIFGDQLLKFLNVYPQSFKAKTDQLSFLFGMVCETWRWYDRFGLDMSFPNSDKKGQIGQNGQKLPFNPFPPL